MPSEEIVDYIRSCRAKGFLDEQIAAELRKAGISEAALGEAWAAAAVAQPTPGEPIAQPQFKSSAEAGESAGQMPHEPKKSSRKWLFILGVLVFAGLALIAVKVLQRAVRPPALDPALQAKLDAYKPERFAKPMYLPEFLPQQTAGNAGEDFRSAAKALFKEKQFESYVCGDPIDEEVFAEAIAHLERAAKKSSMMLIDEVVPLPQTVQDVGRDTAVLIKVLCFSSVFKARAKRLHEEGRKQEALEVGKISVALALHASRTWHTKNSLMGIASVAGSLLTMGTFLDKKNIPADAEMGVRMAYAIKELQANFMKVEEIEEIVKYRRDPDKFSRLQKYLDDRHLRQLHARGVLDGVAMALSIDELQTMNISPQRELFLQAAVNHPDKRVGRFAAALLSVHRDLIAQLRKRNEAERTEYYEKVLFLLEY